MGESGSPSKGDGWSAHYRGYRLQISPDRSVWWQLYNGTDRLELRPVPDPIVDDLLEIKPSGGRIHITETNQVLTRLDEGNREFRDVYVGEMYVNGELVPPEHPEFSIDIQPMDMTVGDLWPSVYDGSRYSFSNQRIWWKNGETKRRHMMDGELDPNILDRLNRYKPKGGSFRITPWGDVITLVPMHPSPEQAGKQFESIPRVIQNVIRLRKERGVDMLPIYVGTIDNPSISVSDPGSITDELSRKERESLSSWAENLGRTSSTNADSHRASSSTQTQTNTSDTPDEDGSTTESNGKENKKEADQDDEELPEDDDLPDDDPLDWIREEVTNQFSNTNEE